MQQELMLDIAVCVVAAWVLAVFFQTVRQPLLLAYLLAGFAIGPHGFGWVKGAQSIETISSIGLILLLFMIGLEIDLKRMLHAGRIITITAGVQIVSCLGAGWLFFRASGMAQSGFEAVYLGMAAALSSTVITVKVLHAKRELETLAGRITLGVLVLQDLAAILFLAIHPNLKSPGAGILLLALGKVALLVSVGLLVSRFLLPPLFKSIAHVPELVLVGALAWCFALAGLANQLELSREMGALVAGISISTYPYTLDVIAKVTGIRDFFVTLFFVGLGMSIPVPTAGLLGSMLLLSLFLVVSRLVTVFVPLYVLKQGHRMSVLPAIYLSQMSELSLVLLALGKEAGDVSDRALSVAAFSFAFLATVSTYASFGSDTLLRGVSRWLTGLGLRDLGGAGAPMTSTRKPRILLLGFWRTASSLLEAIGRERPALLPDLGVVNFNPGVNESLRQRGVYVRHGDISHRDVLLHAGVPEAEIVICSLPNSLLKGADNLTMTRLIRELSPRAKIIVHAESLADIPGLYAASADYVSAPRLLEADHLLEVITSADKNLLEEKRNEQKAQLEKRHEVMA